MGVLDTFSLKGKVALVTGGAGLYGRQIVAALAQAGAKTYIASRNLEALEAVAAEERAATIIAQSGRCDVLVNNAVIRSAMSGWDHDLEAYDKSLRINASALFKITSLFGKSMAANKSGSIINIGSMMGSVGLEMGNYIGTDMMPDPSPIYHYEKGGMLNFTRWAASILGPDNVRVNCLAPGGYFNGQPAAFVKNYSDRTQLGRMANDTDMMGAIVFLASDASAYITGTNIPVDGGYTAK
jgi:NAD(P)-dependent dehydrogenase (short-subunit alcohol dehydrogenase family)